VNIIQIDVYTGRSKAAVDDPARPGEQMRSRWPDVTGQAAYKYSFGSM